MINNIKNKAELYKNILKPSLRTDFGKALAMIELEEVKEVDAIKMINDSLSEDTKITLAEVKTFDAVADLVDNDEKLLSSLWEKRKEEAHFTTLTDLALDYDRERLSMLFHANQIPDYMLGETQKEKEDNLVANIEKKLFHKVPLAGLQRVINSKTLKFSNANIKEGINSFFKAHPNLDIRKVQLREVLKEDTIINALESEAQIEVLGTLKNLQRLSTISTRPEDVAVLYNKKMFSANQISKMDGDRFVAVFGNDLGAATAKQIHANATAAVIANTHRVMQIRDHALGTNVAMIDNAIQFKKGYRPKEDTKISYEALFGSTDFCECGHCNSVYSPSAYFVELLEYIRSNNLDTAVSGYLGTPLEKLFWRRPDLKCLQLTCTNAFTVLPYIDLVNEVMESFIVHNDRMPSNGRALKIKLDSYNTTEADDSATLLAQPQHIHKKAYEMLDQAVYPFNLPYNQALDATRQYLKHLKTSRYELMSTFESYADGQQLLGEDINRTPSEEANALSVEEQNRVQRAQCAEYLGLSESAFGIITQEGFANKTYYELKENVSLTEEQYREKIGLKSVEQYYFAENDLQDSAVLSQVKDEFLPRTGLSYKELVKLLKTNFINPYQPQGVAKAVLDELQISYAFLQNLVDTSQIDPLKKYKPVIEFIYQWHHYLQLKKNNRKDSCGKESLYDCLNKKDILNWVFYHFEDIGKMIVLESNIPVTFKYPGTIETKPRETSVIELNPLGQIVQDNEIIGKINEDLSVEWFTDRQIIIARVQSNNKYIGIIEKNSSDDEAWKFIPKEPFEEARFFEINDTCDIAKVRLQHLDGSPLDEDDYDRLHRFIRLWRKTGWDMFQLDSAISGLNSEIVRVEPVPGIEDYIQQQTADSDDCSCKHLSQPSYRIGKINGKFICKLSKVKQLLESTNLTFEKLLCFWSTIETKGERSLYEKLFLRRNLVAKNPDFGADANGNFLTKPNLKISEFIPALMSGLSMKGDDIELLDRQLLLNDQLTLEHVSKLYRYQLMARHLRCSVDELLKAILLFDDPFESIANTLTFMKDWEAMMVAGLSVHNLKFLLTRKDDIDNTVLPSNKDQLSIAKAIWEGLQEIEVQHNEEITEDTFTPELLKEKLESFYAPELANDIIAFLNGSKTWTTNAPAGLTFDASRHTQLNYIDNDNQSSLSYKGALNDDGLNDLVAEIPALEGALNRIQRQQEYDFHTHFADIIKHLESTTIRTDFKQTLFKKHVPLIIDPFDPSNSNSGSAVEKGLAFLEVFLPFLRNRLKDRHIIKTLSNRLGLSIEVISTLLSRKGCVIDTEKTLLEAFRSIGENISESGLGRFEGFLLPIKSAHYRFEVIGDSTSGARGTIIVDGLHIETHPIDNPDGLFPNNIYQSQSLFLEAGEIYDFHLNGFDEAFNDIKWITDGSQPSKISDSFLYTNHLVQGFQPLFHKLYIPATLVKAYDLSVKELVFFETSKERQSFNKLDLFAPTLITWRRLAEYSKFMEALPEDKRTDFVDVFVWAEEAPDNTSVDNIVAKLSQATEWNADRIRIFLDRAYFNASNPASFKNERVLAKIHKAMRLQEKINAPVSALFDWAKSPDQFEGMWGIFTDIQKVVQARYDLDDWEDIVKPINDLLRTNQRNALISYLLNQKALRDWGVTDADSLFEFFLIDVQMESCMETSRIKQAISSTQLFVQRVLLNLEKPNIEGEDFDKRRSRWEWMSRYRVWEANRKVFLYPENWIRPELRDTKTELYQALESELLQKDINPDMVKDVLKNYLYGLDEIADMKVFGMYAVKEEGESNQLKRLHVISRTRTAPYFFYYRKYESGYWYPWEKMEVDIPSYDYEVDGEIKSNGSYIIPVEWNNRLFVFFPQFLKKTQPVPISNQDGDGNKMTFAKMADDKPVNEARPIEFWEIKMAFSERKKGVWSQKKISSLGIKSQVPYPLKDYNFSLYPINEYIFSISIKESSVEICFMATRSGSEWNGKSFYFTGENFLKSRASFVPPSAEITFGYDTRTNNLFSRSSKYVERLYAFSEENKSMSFSNTAFNHSFSKDLVSSITLSSLNAFYDFIKAKRRNDLNIDFGGFINDSNQKIFHELKEAYSIYNWELFFYLPITIAQNLSENQQFEEAMKWFHFVFHPYENGRSADRFWRFLPFRETDAQNYLENFFRGMEPGEGNEDINQWRNDPFNPHRIARSRTVAYMKWVVMEYLDNLLDWGDHLFRQDTIESINYATQLYILAGHILGKRPQQVPKRGKIKPQSYAQIMHKLDAFGNAEVELELLFPFSNQVTSNFTELASESPVINIFGMATTQYFCTPNNPKLTGYWDTIADRLYKIRHCQNIEGIFRRLSLFEPPIDPALLVNARANGLSISSVLNDLYAPIPNYRFYYILQKALELCNEVKLLGTSFLSLKEKQDGEAIQLLRSKHEIALNELVMESRKLQLEEAQKSLEGLYENRRAPEYRMKYYLQLIGEDLAKVPEEEIDFIELADKLESVIDESGLKLIGLEKEEIDLSNKSKDFQLAASTLEIVAAGLGSIPTTGVDGKPFGIGTTIAYGGKQLSSIATAVARAIQTESTQLSLQASNASRKTGFTRQLQERIQQTNLAGRELKQIDKQIVAQKIRVQLAEQELANHQKQIENSKEVEEFLKSKYTNKQLYQYMEDHMKTLFYQAYTMAYDLAKKAEGLFRFERGLTSSNFIKYGYWNSAYDGLMAGEQLYNGLKQLEIAYQDSRGHDYEIVNKQISLRKLNPKQLLELREKGYCEFEIPKWLFDMDFPGHYKRRIKTVSFSIPCISGPYINISATARILEHSFRVKPTTSINYPQNKVEDDEEFMTSHIPIQAVALSSGQNDGGVFELNFRDERYMPFEGAGCVSKWRIELPDKFRQFDYNTISDLILHMSYTSNEGGQKLKDQAIENLSDFYKDARNLSEEEGLFMIFDLKNDFPTEWYKAMIEPSIEEEYVLSISNIKERLPYFASNKAQLVSIYLNYTGEFEAKVDEVSLKNDWKSIVDTNSLEIIFNKKVKDELVHLIVKYKLEDLAT